MVNETDPKHSDNNGNGDISQELKDLLDRESREAEIQAAMDAAAEEGIYLTREEAIVALILNKHEATPEEPKSDNPNS